MRAAAIQLNARADKAANIETADRLVRRKRFEDGARVVLFKKGPIARESAAALDQFVDQRVVEGPNHDIHRGGEEGMGEGAQLPVAEMGGCEEDAPTFPFRLLVVLHALAPDPIGDRLPPDRREAGEGDQQPCDGPENPVDDGGRVLPGQGEGEVLHGAPAETGYGKVEQPGVTARQPVRERHWQPFQGLKRHPCQSVFDGIT